MKLERINPFTLLSIVLTILLTKNTLVLASSDGNYPGESQINWLKKQQDPINNLVNSYEDGKYFAWTVDQALSVIVFTHCGEVTRAKRILDKMQELQRPDCNLIWNEWYRLDWPNDMNKDWGSEKSVTGPIAWMVIAVNFYECRTKDSNYAPMARRALGWLERLRNIEPNDKYGSIRYCDGPRCGQYDSNEPNWISTEHNIDAYSAYYWRGMLDANDSNLNKASLIMDYLRKEMWAPAPNSNCCRNINVFCRGYDDCEVVTDCQSWGVLALGEYGPDGEPFYKALLWPQDLTTGTLTVQDYNENVQDVNGFRGAAGDNNYIEIDFTEHVAAALFSIGDDINGNYFHSEMGRTADSNGGLVHSFCDHDANIGYFMNDPAKRYTNLRYNYVGSVAWHYFNEARVNPFNLRPCFAECRAANIDNAGRVDFMDYARLALHWLDSGTAPYWEGDINKDGRVQSVDLDILTEYWLKNCDE